MNFFLDSNTLTNKIKKIGNKSVEEKQNLSFALIVTDSSIKNLEFNLEKNPPTGTKTDPKTGKFTWTLQGHKNQAPTFFT